MNSQITTQYTGDLGNDQNYYPYFLQQPTYNYLGIVALSLNPQGSAINGKAEWAEYLSKFIFLAMFFRNRIKACGAGKGSVNLEHHTSRLSGK